MIDVGDTVTAEWTWGGHRFQAPGVVTKVSGKTVKVRLTEHAGEHFAPGFVVTVPTQNVHKKSNMKTTKRRSVQAPRMDSFTRAYFDAALWSTNDESDESGGEPLDKNYGIGDIDPATRDKMIADCANFQERFGELIGGETEQAGHDFWLTRNGHGAGFWDGDWPEPDATTLTNASKEYGEFDLYIGDDGAIYGSPLGGRTREARRGVVAAPGHRVADFNTLDDLIAHARDELGATHVLVDDANTKLYFPRGGQHSYEEASVWRKSGYWHAQGPGSRTGVHELPEEVQPIGGGRAERRAAEASGTTKRIALKSERAMTPLGGRTDTMWVIYDVDTGETLSAGTDEQAERDRFKHMTTSGERFGDSGTRFIAAETRVGQAGRRAAEAQHVEARGPADEQAARELVIYIENESDLSPDGPRGQGRSVLLNALRKWRSGTYDSTKAVRLFEYLAESGAKRYAKEFGSSEEWSTTFTPATRHEAARQLEASFRNSAEQGEYDHVNTGRGAAETPRGHAVRDYIAVDRRGRTTAGPFKTYGDAKSAAGPADVVQFVSREGVEEARRGGGGKQATKPGKHGTLHLWRITYKDSNNPAFGEASFQKWAYDKQAAWDNFNEEVGSEGESWEIVKIEPILDTGPKQLSREARRTGGTRGGPARKYYVVDQVQNELWVQVGHFATKQAAEQFRAKLHGQTRIRHAFPSGHDHPPIAEEARVQESSRETTQGLPVDVLRTLQPGDFVTIESPELHKPRKLIVTSLSQNGVYVSSGHVRPGHRGGGRLHARDGVVFYDATIQQRPVQVVRLTRTAAAMAEHPSPKAKRSVRRRR